MKVMLINGSPHKNGCTNRALEEVAAALRSEGVETEIFWIGAKPISGCVACGACKKLGKCAINDTVNEFTALADSADAFVFGSPVHYAGMGGAIKSFMDRTFYSSGAKFRYKPFACVCSARRAGTTCTYDDMIKYAGITEMPIISSRYWNMVHGRTPEEVEQDAEGMQIMRMLGRNMAYFLKCLEAGKEKGIGLPAREEITMTNFVR